MIQVNNNVRIRVFDINNLVLEELRSVTSKEKGTRQEWCFSGYYSSLKEALLGVFKKKLFDTVNEELTLKDLITRIEAIENDFKKDKVEFAVEQIKNTVELAKNTLGYEKVIDYFYKQLFEEKIEEQINNLRKRFE